VKHLSKNKPFMIGILNIFVAERNMSHYPEPVIWRIFKLHNGALGGVTPLPF